jgi:hypothetical protein
MSERGVRGISVEREERVRELAKQLPAPDFRGAIDTDQLIAQVVCGRAVVELLAEIDRLRRGDFTPEEFQNLCHNSFPCSREVFEQGCKDYQAKLFHKER